MVQSVGRDLGGPIPKARQFGGTKCVDIHGIGKLLKTVFGKPASARERWTLYRQRMPAFSNHTSARALWASRGAGKRRRSIGGPMAGGASMDDARTARWHHGSSKSRNRKFGPRGPQNFRSGCPLGTHCVNHKIHGFPVLCRRANAREFCERR